MRLLGFAGMLDRMSKKMVALGRRGGLRGGAARAAALSPERRSEIAKKAASARWHKPETFDECPRSDDELTFFVGYYGARNPNRPRFNLEDVVVRATKAARRNSAMTRMFPVFLWRLREHLVLEQLIKKVVAARCAPTLGYFLELASKLGSVSTFDTAVSDLKRFADPDHPAYFFLSTSKNPFAVMVAQERTPVDALEWGLLTGTPTDSFESYFRKKVA